MREATATNQVQEHLKTMGYTLVREFKDIFAAETVERCLRESFDRLPAGKVEQFRPVLAYRFARERLQAAAQSTGLMPKDTPEILFVCVHNAGRSQMAAALTSRLGEGRVHVRSAGSTPAPEINPTAVKAMEEAGLDPSQEFPKPLTDEVVQAADVVITMGCGDSCPVYPGKRYLDWEVDDPAGRPLEEVRRIRDDIEGRVRTLLAELGVVVTP
ncbi:MAG: arsenate reductase ArsC [SAR202 cluster bacterium]|nr:arsenate reductase ArsC [SAR202 cluster bacterium]